MNRDLFIVQLLCHHQYSTLWVQMEELGAFGLQAAVNGVNQFTVGVGVLRADLQDVFPRRGVLRNPHLEHTQTEENMSEAFQGNEKKAYKGNIRVCKMDRKLNFWTWTFQFKLKLYS